MMQALLGSATSSSSRRATVLGGQKPRPWLTREVGTTEDVAAMTVSQWRLEWRQSRRTVARWSSLLAIGMLGIGVLGCEYRSVPFGPLTRVKLNASSPLDLLDAILRINPDVLDPEQRRLMLRIVTDRRRGLPMRLLAATWTYNGTEELEALARQPKQDIWLRMVAAARLSQKGSESDDASATSQASERALAVAADRALDLFVRFAALFGLRQDARKRGTDAQWRFIIQTAADASDQTALRLLALSYLGFASSEYDASIDAVFRSVLNSPLSSDEIKLAAAEGYSHDRSWDASGDHPCPPRAVPCIDVVQGFGGTSRKVRDLEVEATLAKLAAAVGTPSDLRTEALGALSTSSVQEGLTDYAFTLFTAPTQPPQLRVTAGLLLAGSKTLDADRATKELATFTGAETPIEVAELSYILVRQISQTSPQLMEAYRQSLPSLIAIAGNAQRAEGVRRAAAVLIEDVGQIAPLHAALIQQAPTLEALVLSLPDQEYATNGEKYPPIVNSIVHTLVNVADEPACARALTTILKAQTARSRLRSTILTSLAAAFPSALSWDLLRSIYLDQDRPAEERAAAVSAIAHVQVDRAIATPELLQIVARRSEATKVRLDAITTLTSIGGPDARTKLATELAESLCDEPLDYSSLKFIGRSLAEMPEEAAAEIDRLGALLSRSDISAERRQHVNATVADVATALARTGRIDALPGLKRVLPNLRMEDAKPERAKVEQAIQYLTDARMARVWPGVRDYLSAHYVLDFVGIYLLASLLACFAMLRIAPLILYNVAEAVTAIPELKLPEWLGGFAVPARHLFAPWWFRHHERVLNAWITRASAEARAQFDGIAPVKLRQLRVPTPVRLDGVIVAGALSSALRPIAERTRLLVSIEAEGGAGKSTLAFELAKQALSARPDERWLQFAALPILIDFEMPFVSDPQQAGEALLAIVRTQLEQSAGHGSNVTDDLVNKLLRKKRLVFICDRYSELTLASQEVLRRGIHALSIGVVVVTARRRFDWQGIVVTRIEPTRIKGDALAEFSSAYLACRGAREGMLDGEYFALCGQLSAIVGGGRDVTPMFAAMYLDFVIDQRSKAGPAREAPATIPDLVGLYIERIWSSVSAPAFDLTATLAMSGVVAGECVGEHLRLTNADKRTVEARLGLEGAAKLRYLADVMGLVQIAGTLRDQVRYALDPLAEYMAALHFLSAPEREGGLWSERVRRLEQAAREDDANSNGFILALRTCWAVKSLRAPIPEVWLERLSGTLAIRSDPPAEARRTVQ